MSCSRILDSIYVDAFDSAGRGQARHDGVGMKNPAIAFALVALSGPALAQETVTYQYDALGRLVRSDVAGGPNNQVQTSIAYDPASNRTNYAVANAPTGPGPGTPPKPKLIVVPLNGFTIIPIK